MKKILFFIAILPLASFAQTPIKTFVKGEVKELNVSPDESVWLCDNAGYIYKTTNFADIETKYTFPTPKPDYFGEQTINIDRITFFNKDNFFVSGYIGDDLIGKDQGTPNKVFVTKDGGTNWEAAKFTSKGIWVYDCFTTNDGKAWIGGSDGNMFYSDDFAKTWKKCSSPYNSSDRLSKLYLSNTIGIAAALENKLKISTDNFLTFKKIETPLDQNKYTDPNKAKPEYTVRNIFSKVAILNNYFIVNQINHVFYSKTDVIDWMPFSKDIKQFEIDQQGQKIIALTPDNKFISFSSTFQYESELMTIPEEETVKDFKVVNGKLFVLTETYAKAKDGDDVVGTVGNMTVTRVGYKKVAAYKIYKKSATENLSAEFKVRKLIN